LIQKVLSMKLSQRHLIQTGQTGQQVQMGQLGLSAQSTTPFLVRKGTKMNPQFGLCPVCWTVGGMALLGGIPLLGGLAKKFFKAKDKPQSSCQATGDTFCQCSKTNPEPNTERNSETKKAGS
jgi:hypothetical protein